MEIWATRAAEIMQPSPVVMGTLLGTSWNNWNYIKLYFFPYTQFTPASYKRMSVFIPRWTFLTSQAFFFYIKNNTHPLLCHLLPEEANSWKLPSSMNNYSLSTCFSYGADSKERGMTTMILITKVQSVPTRSPNPQG
jgi:hypothetical protein